MNSHHFPEYLTGLYSQEEFLREKSMETIEGDTQLCLHIHIVERAMDIAYVLRQFPTEDEDLKVVQVLGMRTFNALGASVKLSLSGYTQNSTLIMRDILETVFLLDLFGTDRTALRCWRLSDDKRRRQQFSPVKVRETLDERDGVQGKKRAELYALFSELAGHPTMKSHLMMRPEPDGDVVIGPFFEESSLRAVVSEMGKLALQVGEVLDRFIPQSWSSATETRLKFARAKQLWIDTFYPQ